MLHDILTNYASRGLAVIPALPASKEAAVRWKCFQLQPPTLREVEAMFSPAGAWNIGVICGAASANLMVIDAETKSAFADTLRHCERAGVRDTWVVETARGGHIYVRTPVPVRPLKTDDFEVRGQGQYVLAPPSLHPTGKLYSFISKPDTIVELPSLDAIDWLKLQPAPQNHQKRLPRKAARLLQGWADSRYKSRSEVEQAIVASLVNAGFTFDAILTLFQKHRAAGKFAELQREDPQNAIRWLRLSFERARLWCMQESPSRKQARQTLEAAMQVAWPGQTGSTDRAVFLAHATLAYRAGRDTYHASCRNLAELAACTKETASRSTKRLMKAGRLAPAQACTQTSARRFKLCWVDPRSESLEYTPSTTIREGVYSSDSLSIPDAFRQRGLGRPAYEVWITLQRQPMTVAELAEGTGRHIQTVRRALKRMQEIVDWATGDVYSLVECEGWRWRALTNVNLDDVARALGTYGVQERQKQQHRAERLRHQLALKRRGIE